MQAGRYNFIYLFFGLVGMLLWVALEKQFPDRLPTDFVGIAFELTLILGVWSMVEARIWRVAGMVMAIAGALLFGFGSRGGEETLEHLGYMVTVAFYGMTIVLAFTHVLFVGPITSNKIFGVMSVYLMMGIIWALIYYFVSLLGPDAFNGIDLEGRRDKIPEALYFSFVTLSTLGYGDITPLSPLARFFAYIEAIMGQFYIAIVVAATVSAYINKEIEKEIEQSRGAGRASVDSSDGVEDKG